MNLTNSKIQEDPYFYQPISSSILKPLVNTFDLTLLICNLLDFLLTESNYHLDIFFGCLEVLPIDVSSKHLIFHLAIGSPNQHILLHFMPSNFGLLQSPFLHNINHVATMSLS